MTVIFDLTDAFGILFLSFNTVKDKVRRTMTADGLNTRPFKGRSKQMKFETDATIVGFEPFFKVDRIGHRTSLSAVSKPKGAGQ